MPLGGVPWCQNEGVAPPDNWYCCQVAGSSMPTSEVAVWTGTEWTEGEATGATTAILVGNKYIKESPLNRII